MKISILAVLFLAFAAKEVVSQACHMREIDLCTAIGMFQFQSNGVPSNEEELDEFCEAMKEVMDCTRNYTSKCMSPLQRELVALFTGADEQAGKLCTPGTEARARYLKHSECLSQSGESDNFKNHIKNILAALQKTFEQPFYQRLPTACCGFKRFQKDTHDTTEEHCGKDAVDMTRQLTNMILTDIPDIVCESFEPEGEVCTEILPERGTPLKEGESDKQILKLINTVFGNL